MVQPTQKDSRVRPPCRGGWLCCTAILLVNISLPAAADSQFTGGGYAEYQLRQQGRDGQQDSVVQLLTTRANLATYLWQPWIATLDGGVGLTFSRAEGNSSESRGELLTGEARLNVLPRSPFPFQAFYERRDSRVDSELVGPDFRVTSFGFLQRYAPPGGARASISYRRTDDEQSASDRSAPSRMNAQDAWQVSLAQSLGHHTIDLNSRWRNLERDSGAEAREKRTTHTLRHRFSPAPAFFTETTAFVNDENIELGATVGDRRFAQVNSMATWRPGQRRNLLITATGLMQGTDMSLGTTGNETRNIVVTAGAVYQRSDSLSFSVRSGISETTVNGQGEGQGHFERLRASYLSRSRPLGKYRYSWNGTTEFGNRRDPLTGSRREFVLGAGHSLVRNVGSAAGHQLQLSISQNGSMARTTRDDQLDTLTHTAAATWNSSGDRGSSFVRLSATDRRRLDGDNDTFRLANLQVSRNYRRSRDAEWSGGLTIQSIISDRETAPASGDNRSLSYSANLRYTRNDLFGVPRLRFHSEAQYLSNQFRTEELRDDLPLRPEDRQDRVWRNRLDYRVGRLLAGLHVNVVETETGTSSLVYFRLRRDFGPPVRSSRRAVR